ncbi:hypothetical protein GQ53DRAFT_821043 [Thozetella sp. PMI_491]|nr:hypothetical protein GQ53DRAFT_821043 [Thozetella sp. PMI_491]
MSTRGLQYSNEEWLREKPIIMDLYLRGRPLTSVMRIMERDRQFAPSISMYKRKFREWDIRKNNTQRGLPTNAPVPDGQLVCGPRDIPQSDVDESLHTLLNLLSPWIDQAAVLWRSSPHTRHMHCPPRAAYIYDDFTHGITLAAAAFRSGNPDYGGVMLRQAFVDMERTLSPRAKSAFTLHSLFLALMILNQEGMFTASRMLVEHATNLVDAIMQGNTEGNNNPKSPLVAQLEPEPEEGIEYLGEIGHINHPFPQILKRLKRLAVELDANDAQMANSVFRAWSAYHRATRAAGAKTVATEVSRREYWSNILQHPVPIGARQGTMGAAVSRWRDWMQPELDCLNMLLHHADCHADDDLALIYLDEIASVYSFSNDGRFEATALQLMARAELKKGQGVAWGGNATLELANYYKERGQWDKAMRCLDLVVPDKAGNIWKQVFFDELQSWTREQGHPIPWTSMEDKSNAVVDAMIQKYLD